MHWIIAFLYPVVKERGKTSNPQVKWGNLPKAPAAAPATAITNTASLPDPFFKKLDKTIKDLKGEGDEFMGDANKKRERETEKNNEEENKRGDEESADGHSLDEGSAAGSLSDQMAEDFVL